MAVLCVAKESGARLHKHYDNHSCLIKPWTLAAYRPQVMATHLNLKRRKSFQNIRTRTHYTILPTDQGQPEEIAAKEVNSFVFLLDPKYPIYSLLVAVKGRSPFLCCRNCYRCPVADQVFVQHHYHCSSPVPSYPGKWLLFLSHFSLLVQQTRSLLFFHAICLNLVVFSNLQPLWEGVNSGVFVFGLRLQRMPSEYTDFALGYHAQGITSWPALPPQ